MINSLRIMLYLSNISTYLVQLYVYGGIIPKLQKADTVYLIDICNLLGFCGKSKAIYMKQRTAKRLTC